MCVVGASHGARRCDIICAYFFAMAPMDPRRLLRIWCIVPVTLAAVTASLFGPNTGATSKATHFASFRALLKDSSCVASTRRDVMRGVTLYKGVGFTVAGVPASGRNSSRFLPTAELCAGQ